MSEPDTSTTDAPDTTPEGGEGGGKQYTPPATQADLDRIIADRVARAKAQFKDYTDLKTKAAQFDQLQAANQTDLERAQGELSNWQQQAEQWRTAALSSRVETLASTDFADPSDALAALGDPTQFLDAGGVIDDDAIRNRLAELLDRKPHWRRQDNTPQGPRTPAPNPAQGQGGQAATSPADEFAALIRRQIGTG